MKTNIYTKTLLKKTDSELESILSNKNKYVEDAINAAESILNSRKGTIIDEPETKSKIKNIEEPEGVLSIEKKAYLTDDPNSPELYTRSTIMVFSALFGVIFGTALMIYNFKNTKNSRGIIVVIVFGILYFFISLSVLNLLNTSIFLTIIVNLFGGAILTGVFWSKYIGIEFRHREKSWLLAAVISLAIVLPLTLLMIWIS